MGPDVNYLVQRPNFREPKSRQRRECFTMFEAFAETFDGLGQGAWSQIVCAHLEDHACGYFRRAEDHPRMRDGVNPGNVGTLPQP
jgi:hypothetical protein